MILKGEELVKISAAIVAAFDGDDLVELTLRCFDTMLDDIVPEGAMKKRSLALVVWANKRGTIADLVRAAFSERQNVPEWQELNRQFGSSPAISLQDAGTVNEVVAGPPATSALERTIRPHLGLMDMAHWVARFSELEAQVCRVERGTKPLGTGFLVGPDLVLTAYHNVEQGAAQEPEGSLQCRFDYKRLGDGTVQQGRVCELAPDWLVASSPYSEADTGSLSEDVLPKPDELDFALVRLSEPIGRMTISSARTRGWISPPAGSRSPQAHSGLIIVQHPAGEPIKVAFDAGAIIGTNANGTRLRYTTTTEPGSGGSPCFDFDLSLVAMHHARDRHTLNPRYGQGIPIGLIAERIAPFLPRG
jgi:hypothetical protein